jgi:phospholipase A1
MEQHFRQSGQQRRFVPVYLAQVTGLAIALAAPLWSGNVQAQVSDSSPQARETTWQQCASLSDDRDARLSCFDRWATQQPGNALLSPASTAASSLSLLNTSAPVALAPAPVPPAGSPASPSPVTITMEAPAAHDCKNPGFSELSRFWELEAGSDCGTFGIRGFRPISLSWIGSDSVNVQPASPATGHTATSTQAYTPSETRIQVSVRTKIAQGLLTGLLDGRQSLRRDSLWFGYTQQSYWQLFNGDLSRPFRSTDHEPEITYIYPTEAELPGGWRLRYSGLSLVHQSNGQTLPLSRSWNRLVLMAGLEKGSQFQLQGRLWQRLPEHDGDDDNPDISDYIGRAELIGSWSVNKDNTLVATVRHSLQADTNGSLRLEWLKNLADSGIAGGRNNLRFHTQLFTGYGDSLLDYNRRRTVLSIGLSLVDW